MNQSFGTLLTTTVIPSIIIYQNLYIYELKEVSISLALDLTLQPKSLMISPRVPKQSYFFRISQCLSIHSHSDLDTVSCRADHVPCCHAPIHTPLTEQIPTVSPASSPPTTTMKYKNYAPLSLQQEVPTSSQVHNFTISKAKLLHLAAPSALSIRNPEGIKTLHTSPRATSSLSATSYSCGSKYINHSIPLPFNPFHPMLTRPYLWYQEGIGNYHHHHHRRQNPYKR